MYKYIGIVFICSSEFDLCVVTEVVALVDNINVLHALINGVYMYSGKDHSFICSTNGKII